jgi:hypothetical protein
VPAIEPRFVGRQPRSEFTAVRFFGTSEQITTKYLVTLADWIKPELKLRIIKNYKNLNICVYCLPFTVYCLPFTVYRLLFTVYRFTVLPFYRFTVLPFTVYRLPFTVYRLLFTVYRLLFTVYRLLFTVYRLPFTVYSLLFTYSKDCGKYVWARITKMNQAARFSK